MHLQTMAAKPAFGLNNLCGKGDLSAAPYSR
jgi:hypothetical protein